MNSTTPLDPITTQSTRIWDLPTRLFHWLLVVLVVLQFGTAQYGWLDMQWHFWFGYALLALLVFRILWGFFGSETARFTHFITSPRRAFAYLRNWSNTPMARFAGHNPAGGWASLIILLVVLAQALSGLFTSDDIEWFGPLCHRVSDTWIEWGSWLHHRLEPIILGLVALHVIAIAVYWFIKRENLVGSLWHGRRDIAVTAPLLVDNLRAVLIFLCVVAGVVMFIWWLE
jgi:cytochrome b